MTFHLWLQLLGFLGPLVLMLVLMGGVTCAALALWKGRTVLIWGAAGAIVVALVLAALLPPAGTLPPIFTILVTLLALALAVLGGGPATLLTLELATRGSVPQGVHGGILVAVDAPSDAEPQLLPRAKHEVLRGGATIGVLERVASAGALIAGVPEALAVIIAIKGVGRFSELAAAEARERFIIGTFASLIWACACGALARIVIG